MIIAIQERIAIVVVVRTMLAAATAIAETLRMHIIDLHRHHVQVSQHLLLLLLHFIPQPPCNHLDLHSHRVLALLHRRHHDDIPILTTTIKQFLHHILSLILLLPLAYHVLRHVLSNPHKFPIKSTINSSSNVHDHRHHNHHQIVHPLHHYFPSYSSLQ